MYAIGVVGPRAGDSRLDESVLKTKVNGVLEILSFQYGPELILNVDGETGTGHLLIQSAKQLGIKYHLFVPCPIELMSAGWFEAQQQKLKDYYNGSSSITIASGQDSPASQQQRDEALVDASRFVVCFWEHAKQGRTFEVIKYALAANKLVLNGLDELKMISNLDLKKWRRT